MASELDRLMAEWRERPLSPPLDQLEPLVWARIAATRDGAASGVLGFRAALVAVMMGVGVVAGGAAVATAAEDASPFAIHAALAPSSLLEGGR